jgi:hypothetical protein
LVTKVRTQSTDLALLVGEGQVHDANYPGPRTARRRVAEEASYGVLEGRAREVARPFTDVIRRASVALRIFAPSSTITVGTSEVGR